MTAFKPVVFGSVGLGGYAGATFLLLNNCSKGPLPDGTPSPIRFVAVCEPEPDKHPEKVAIAKENGIEIYTNYDEFLKRTDIEAIWIPIPIDLHRPFTEKALAAGKAVICEKPAAGSIDDVDAMIAARDKARLPVGIGFMDTADPSTLPGKKLILNGDLGKIEYASVYACWPRYDKYYERANWAGKLKRNNTWVLDSPANNALAHYINIALFLLGPTLDTSATPADIEAELYRTVPIENYDTVAMRMKLNTGVTLQVMFTHACETTIQPQIEIIGDKGRYKRDHTDITIESQGKPTVHLTRQGDCRALMVKKFAQTVRGIPNDDVVVCSLESARAHAVAINAASEASAITNVPKTAYRELTSEAGKLWAIQGIENAFTQCSRERKMLHESGLFPWTRPAGRKNDLLNYRHFAGPKMAE